MPKRELVITQPAKDDLAEIDLYSRENFGGDAARNYNQLIKQALYDIADDPVRPGSKTHPEISPETRSYRIALSKERAGSAVKNPRHLIFYFDDQGEALVVTRILHDSRDFKRHLSRDDNERDPGNGGRSR